jgi:hypothetical protein
VCTCDLKNPNKELKEEEAPTVQMDQQEVTFNKLEEGEQDFSKPLQSGMELNWLEFLEELFDEQAV